MISSRIALAVAISLYAVPAMADAAVDAATQPQPGRAQEAHHNDHADEIIVTGVRRRAEDVLGGISVLDEADLTREMRSSIGETLARQPGVSATSFAPAGACLCAPPHATPGTWISS